LTHPQLSAAFDLVRPCILAVAEDIIVNLRLFAMQMFMMPSLITMSIAATRMYRSLADFLFYTDMYGSLISPSSGTDRYGGRCSGNGSDSPPKIDRVVLDTRWRSTVPLPRKQMEMTMEISHERWQSSASQTGHYMFSDGQFGDKLGGQNLDDDVESGAEKYIPN